MDVGTKYVFKIILIGDSGVGKTSLATRFTDRSYTDSTISTIGVDFKIKTTEVDGTKVKLQVWDTAGQERFRAIVSNYYRGAHGIFIVFDMLNRASFEHVGDWIEEIGKKGAHETAEVMILGNKSEENPAVITDEEIFQFLDKYDIPRNRFVKVSAKNDVGVDESFKELTKKLIAKTGSSAAKTVTKSSLNVKKRGCC